MPVHCVNHPLDGASKVVRNAKRRRQYRRRPLNQQHLFFGHGALRPHVHYRPRARRYLRHGYRAQNHTGGSDYERGRPQSAYLEEREEI